MAAKTWHSSARISGAACTDGGRHHLRRPVFGWACRNPQSAVRSPVWRRAQARILFDRDGGRLRPTGEAVRLNRRLDPLFAALDDGSTARAHPSRNACGLWHHRHMRIGSLSSTSPRSFAPTHRFFVALDVAPSDEVIRGILEERFDLGIIGVELSRDGLKLTPFRVSSPVCVMPVNHALATRDIIHAADLHEQPLIALTHRHARRAQLEKELTAAVSKPRIVAEVSTSVAAVDLARAGLGVAVVNPFPIVHFRADDVAFRPFASGMEYRSYFVTSDNNPLPRLTRAFIRHQRLHTDSDPFSRKA